MVSLFTTETPTLTNGQDGAPGITPSTTLQFAVPGVITHIRWYVGAFNGAGTWTGSVWVVGGSDEDGDGVPAPGSPVASKVGTVTVEGGWNQVELDTPIPVETDTLYRVGMHNDARYVATNGFFAAPLTNGPITAPADGSDPLGNGWTIAQGTFKSSADPLAYPNQSFGSTSYFVDVVFEPDAEEPDLEASGALTLPALQAAGELSAGVELSGTVTLPALLAVGELAATETLTGGIVLPALTAAGELAARVEVVGAITLPALDAAGAVTAEQPDGGEEPDSEIPGVYGEIVAGLKAALKPYGLRVARNPTETVGSRDVVVGPPAFTWEGLCDPDEPDTVTFSVYLIEAWHERATERLLANLPALIRGVQQYNDATITGPVQPGAFPSGASDLPCYQLTVEMTL